MADYDDIFLIPRGISSISSRSEVSLESSLFGLYPFWSSPMRGISGSKLVIEFGKNNCLGIIHRFQTIENRLKMISDVAKENILFGVAIGFGKDLEEFKALEIPILKNAVERGAIVGMIDVANGYIKGWEARGRILKDIFPDLRLAGGNVVTQEGASYLKQCGFDYIRVGIGSGFLCETRRVTGVGRSQLSAIADCSHVDVKIISDGGINEPGKAVKSFAYGSDFVMLGSLLGQSLEAEHDGIIFGMASHRNMMLTGKQVKSIEGRDVVVEKKLPLKEILDQFIWGVRSACTYLDCSNVRELSYKCRIVSVSEA